MSAKNLIKLATCCLCKDLMIKTNIFLVNKFGNVCENCYKDEKNVEFFKNRIFLKNEPLEEYLSTMEIKINCKYQPIGCNDILNGKNKKNHEQTCKYRKVRCPFKEIEKCRRNNDIHFDGLLKHFHDIHKDNFLSIEDATFTISFGNQNDSTSNTFIKILSFYDQYFLLKYDIDFQTSKFTYDLYYFTNIEEDITPSPSHVITFVGENEEKMNLERKFIPIKEYFNSSGNSNVIDLNFLRQTLINSKMITFKISLNNIPETFINILECPICTNLMVPPIFQCKLGHSICEECKKKVTECPTCENPFNETRNYLAEELSTQYNMLQKQAKCSNYKCDFKGSEDMLKKHEKVCSHKPKTCPICGMEILVDIEAHCKIFHGPPLFFSKKCIYVFIDVTYMNKQLGRIIFELRSDVVPKTAQHFRALCTGEKGFGYKGSMLGVGWTVKDILVHGIGIIGGNRTIYGESFEQENFILKHSRPGILTMKRNDDCKTTSIFRITTTKCEEWDNKYVAIGSVLVGMDVVNNIFKLPKGSHCIITNCGQF